MTGGLAAASWGSGGLYEPVVAILGGSAMVVMAAALLAPSQALAVAAIGLLIAEYLLSLTLAGSGIDPGAVIYGGGLLLAGEMAALSVDRAPPAPKPEAAVSSRRLIALGVALLAGMAAGGAGLATAALPMPGGIAVTMVGVSAAVGILALITRLARSSL